MQYEIKPLTGEEESYIEKKIGEYAYAMAPPEPDTAFIGFFMMRKDLQGRQIGSAIIRETAEALNSAGKTAIRLGIDKENPQSTHFWKKNGFEVIREADLNGWTKLVAERKLEEGSGKYYGF